jgi:flagellar hook-basal body complex protein FliE
MIHFDPRTNPLLSNTTPTLTQMEPSATPGSDFSQVVKAAGKYISSVDEMQQASDTSIAELLTGKNNDLTAVVSAVAEADVGFKVLVGVRNKLIEAYKQTMNMPL